MDTISLLPDKKLRTKQFMVLGTLSLFIILLALILQITIPLGKKTSADQVAEVLWPICSAAIILIWIISTPLITLWIKNLKYIVETNRMSLHKGIFVEKFSRIFHFGLSLTLCCIGHYMTDFWVLHQSGFKLPVRARPQRVTKGTWRD